MTAPAFPLTLPAFARQFSTGEACHDYLRQVRWPEGFVCPRDGLPAATYITTRGLWRCPKGHETSVTAGTVLHGTHTDICTWFWAAFLMATHTPGVSAWQLHRQLGLRFETAYQMLQKLRAGMVNPEREALTGTVEVDESFLGGKRAGKPGRSRARGKYLIAAAVEVRGPAAGRVRLRRIRSESAAQLGRFLNANVVRGSTVRTDGLPSYIGATQGYRHVVVTGETSVAVAKKLPHVHRVFSNLKAWINGTHHGVSGKHLQAYLNEFTFRFNRRKTPMAAFNAVLRIGTRVLGPTYRGIYRAGRKDGWRHPNPPGVVAK